MNAIPKVKQVTRSSRLGVIANLHESFLGIFWVAKLFGSTFVVVAFAKDFSDSPEFLLFSVLTICFGLASLTVGSRSTMANSSNATNTNPKENMTYISKAVVSLMEGLLLV